MDEKVPTLTTEQMVEVDRAMINDYGITLIQMMENAGRNLAELTRRKLGGSVRGKRVEVLAGRGGNGGGGMVAARHLSNWGATVRVTLTRQVERLGDIPAHQWNALSNMPVERDVYDADMLLELNRSDAILDAMIGYSLKGNPRGAAAKLIELANASGSGNLVIALDTPSGLDTTKGIPGEPCIRANATLTLALPKVGLLTPEAAAVTGELYLADISVPPGLYAGLGLEIGNIFERDTIMRLTAEGEIANG